MDTKDLNRLIESELTARELFDKVVAGLKSKPKQPPCDVVLFDNPDPVQAVVVMTGFDAPEKLIDVILDVTYSINPQISVCAEQAGYREIDRVRIAGGLRNWSRF